MERHSLNMRPLFQWTLRGAGKERTAYQVQSLHARELITDAAFKSMDCQNMEKPAFLFEDQVLVSDESLLKKKASGFDMQEICTCF